MSKRSTKYYRKNENEVMKRLGFNPTINSGAGWIQKEDGENEYSTCQLKSTDKKSIRIKQDDLHILEEHAVISHKVPIFALQFLNTGETWLMIRPDDIGKIKALYDGKEIEKSGEYFDFSIDIGEEKSYNKDNSKSVKDSFNARNEYYKNREREMQNRKKKNSKKGSKNKWEKN